MSKGMQDYLLWSVGEDRSQHRLKYIKKDLQKNEKHTAFLKQLLQVKHGSGFL